MTKKLTPAVGYVRMSSGKQEASPGQQRAEIKKLAKRHNCSIVRWYFDEGISGDATEKRVAFRQMIQDAEHKRDFAVILCWDQSRFGRFDSIEAGRWIYPLRQAGVWLITVAEGQIDWNDFAGRMIYSIQQEGKHQYLIDLSRNVLRGRAKAARDGKPLTGPSYGFDREFYDSKGKLVQRVGYGEKFTRPDGWTVRHVPSKDQQALDTVQWLFKRFVDADCSLRSLAIDLNKRKVSAPHGGKWNPTTIRYILTNRVYLGARTFGGRRSGKYTQLDNGGELVRANGRESREPPIVIEAVHESLVDCEVFEQVQEKLAKRRGSNSKPRHNGHLLTGVLRCGHCGRPMCGKSSGSNGRPGHRYYYCPGVANGQCFPHSVRQDALNDYILDTIHNRLFAPRAVEQIKKAIHRRAKDQDGFRDTTDGLQRQIDALDKKITKGTENLLLADPDDMGALSELLGQWREQRTQLQSELEATITKASGSTAKDRADRAIGELKNLRRHFRAADPLKVRAVVKAVVENIELWWEQRGIRYTSVAKGVLTFRSDVGVLDSFHSTASDHRPRENDDP